MAALVGYLHYNDLPSLEGASIPASINDPIRDVFKHNAHLTHCLYLQHRHHTIGADEAIVKVESTAHLMDDESIKDISTFGNKVVPTTWMAFWLSMALA
ncbi:hypothetical protein DL769_004997 [Monosporascus sp. CRB-8-3]|nr:hypothetical protein DL769_004997 [Monosporascus sp. CRB-8-3]